jgi:hypothetical protein
VPCAFGGSQASFEVLEWDQRMVYSKPGNHGPMDTANLLWGYVDSDWAGCPDSRRSTSGYVLMLNGAAVSWKPKRQSAVALSSAEPAFVAASAMVQEVIYSRRSWIKWASRRPVPRLSTRIRRRCRWKRPWKAD